MSPCPCLKEKCCFNSHLSNDDVAALYRLNSDTMSSATPRETYAGIKLKSANWLTRTVIKLEESNTKFEVINKIAKVIAKIICYLLSNTFKASISQFRAQRAEILGFNFLSIKNSFKLIKSIFGNNNEIHNFYRELYKEQVYNEPQPDPKGEALTVRNREAGMIFYVKLISNQKVHILSQYTLGGWVMEEFNITNPHREKAYDLVNSNGESVRGSDGTLYFDKVRTLIRNHLNSIAAPAP